jgi:hypothetical protein
MTGRFTCLSCGCRFEESDASGFKCGDCFKRSEHSKQRSIIRARRRADDVDARQRRGDVNLRSLLSQPAAAPA